MAVEAVVSVVIQKLTHLLIQESDVFNQVTEEVEGMRIELRHMQTILKDAEHQQGRNETLGGWVADFLRIVYKVEYAIDVFALETIRFRRMGLIKKCGVMMKNELAGYRKEMRMSDTRLKEEIDNIRKNLDDSRSNKPSMGQVGCNNGYSSKDEAQTTTQLWPEIVSYYDKEEEEEEEEEKSNSVKEETLVNQLTNNNLPLQIHSILGERGSGNTKVAKRIYNKSKGYFEFHAWVTVPGVPTTNKSLFLVILQQITPPQLKNKEKLETDALRDRLHEFLKTKKYLIVIGDINTHKSFQELRAVFPNMYNGSRMMFTTSDKQIASFADPLRRYNFKPPATRHNRSSSEDEMQPPVQHWPETGFYYAEEEKSTSIFRKDEHTLVNQLINNNRQLQIHSILGELGSGKTTVAKTIYKKIRGRFEFSAWVTVPRVPEARSLFVAIVRQITIPPPQLKNEEKLEDNTLRDGLHKFLKTKKYLIVIDDIEIGKCFQELRVVFPNMSNGSRIVFTTSNKDISSFADPWRRYNFKPLDTDDSWKLFLNNAPALKGNSFPHHVMLHLKDEVIEICKGLPLRIMMLAGLLSTRRVGSDEWWKILEQQSSELPRSIGDLGPCSDILNFCYHDLPLHLKPCFLYLGLFPVGFEIPVRRLFRLWLAEGFVKRSPGMIPEDLVEGYLEELVNRNMVEISERRSDESPKRCRMLGILHEIFLSKAVQIGLFHIHRNSNNNSEAAPQFGVRRLVEYADIKDSVTCHQDIRSYISFNHQKKDMPAEEVGNYLERIIGTRGFGLLRVLDLERVYKPRLPENLGNLFYLRYLGLRWTFLDTLPLSVGDLYYLETLDIKHTYISTLPSSIWKMKHLRHLCLNETRLDMSIQRLHRRSLTQLQTLWGLYVDGKSSSKTGLNRLINLRKLGLTSQSTSFQGLSTWISTLASLQSLRLRSKDKMGRPSKLILKPFSSLENLTRLYLLGSLTNQIVWYQFPPGLKVLTLSVSKLSEDPMPTLAQLPSLVVLRLLAASYTGKEMICPPQGFPVLQVLKLWKLNELEKWTVQKGAMENLCSLEIRCCNMLKELPQNLLQLRTFEKLILTNMPKTFVSHMRRKKQRHTDIVENNWE